MEEELKKKNLDVMLNIPVIVKGLDGKDYKISRLTFPDAFKLGDKLSLLNMLPVVSLGNREMRETLLDILELVLQYNHPEMTRKKLITEKIFDLGHIKRILSIAVDINELKK